MQAVRRLIPKVRRNRLNKNLKLLTWSGSLKRSFLTTQIPEISQIDPNIKSYADLYKFSIDKPSEFWGAVSSRIQWDKPFDSVLKGDFASGPEWFSGGKLNASVNCVDRHAQKNPDALAIIFEKDEPNQQEYITFKQLHKMVVQYSWVLRNVAQVKKGDRVSIYLPCGPSAVAMSLACARIGAIHSIVFAGFSSQALASRIIDADSSTVVTCDVAVRGGRTLPLKPVVDEALDDCPGVQKVLVDIRDEQNPRCAMTHPRDVYLKDVIPKDPVEDYIESMDSNDPLFLLYTSGSTGKPKGIEHTTAGYLLYAMFTHQNVFDAHPGDIFGCVADIGWITGHSYAMYGPLANGVTTLLFESTPIYPDPGRYWEMVERLKLTQIYCAPTAIRLLLRYGSDWVKKYDRKTLRVLGSVGEPINHDAWDWYHSTVGDENCDVVDTWWQTETGGICLSPRPSGKFDPIHPAMPMRPFYGIKPKIMDGGNEGPLCLTQPWPGMAKTIWRDKERFHQTYFAPFAPFYFSGDGAILNADGHWKITGRMDDVINVTGHRVGTAEVEDALDQHSTVSESAVVGFPHHLKGEGIFAFVVLKEGSQSEDKEKLQIELKKNCRQNIAAFAVPDYIMFNNSLPKTRSGKIMRRILRKIAIGKDLEDMGDTSTLADPSVVQELIQNRLSMKNTPTGST